MMSLSAYHASRLQDYAFSSITMLGITGQSQGLLQCIHGQFGVSS